MSGRSRLPTRGTLAPAAAALTMAVGLAGIALVFVPTRPGVEEPNALLAVVLVAAFVLVTPALGALLARRRPEDPTGWLFMLMTFFMVLSFLADSVARHLVPSVGLSLFAVVANGVGAFAFAMLFIVFQVFPTGRFLPGWRWLPVGALIATAIQVVSSLLGPASFTPPIPGLVNPLARPDWRPALEALGTVAGILLLAVAAGTVVSLGLRFRRARGVERQQIKWFAWAAMLVVCLMAASLLTSPLGPLSDAFWMLALSSLVLLPVAATAAILRYRLWDIDRIVSRTVGYATVTGILGTTFAVLVLAFDTLLAPLAGGGTLAVAASTLAVAALFQPLRRRVQRLVDRRFERRRYDSERTVAEFATELREELELDVLTERTRTTVAAALAPRQVTVWMRKDAA